MFNKLFWTFICLYSSSVCGTDICIKSTPCKCVLSAGRVIDLSSVGNIKSPPRFYEIVSGVANDTSLYSYNPCYAFDSPDPYASSKAGNKPCKNAAGCVRTPGGHDGEAPEEHALGIQSEAKLGFYKDLEFHINYTVPNAQQTLTVKLKCLNDTDKHHLEINNIETDVNKHVVMTLSSKCACDNGCVTSDPGTSSDGLSTGSKLLIAFFSILLIYFILGTGWNLFNGAQGVELVPNYAFWNDLPKLIIDGLVFTCSCFGKKSSYGEV